MKHVEMIDIEPTWKSIVNSMKLGHLSIEHSWDSLDQMANVCDVIRKAQKKDIIIVTLPDGSYVEMSKAEWDEVQKCLLKE